MNNISTIAFGREIKKKTNCNKSSPVCMVSILEFNEKELADKLLTADDSFDYVIESEKISKNLFHDIIDGIQLRRLS